VARYSTILGFGRSLAEGGKKPQNNLNMGHNQALRVGQFSMQILGHFSVQINRRMLIDWNQRGFTMKRYYFAVIVTLAGYTELYKENSRINIK